ncbi:MAG: hypothetical protein GW914_02915, partial [Candidatus Aenigmarchaeota archaeon]|nr:hypothetical protein [Candidatus Aenigmarchaeota archaeon]
MKTIIENIVIKYRNNLNEKQDSKKIFKVAMGSSVKPELVKDIPKGMKLIEEITNEVNSWSDEKINDEFVARGLEEEKKEKVKKTLVFPRMENIVDGKVLTISPPEPSKYPHIGHAYAAYINFLFAKEHNGKYYLRFEDTNPALTKEEYYDAQLNGLKWLGINPDGIIYASDHMNLLYEKVRFLIINEHAYVCNCSSEIIRDNRMKKKECECRLKNSTQNIPLWEQMIEGKFKPGKASVRLRGDMKSKYAEFRDPVLMRINDGIHPRTGS